MKPFDYYNPVNIMFGEKQNLIGDILKADGHKNILLAYGKSSIKRTGLYDQICKTLNKAGIKFIEHSGISSNPILSHAVEGVKKAKDVTAILAVGGGSVVDESKAIAAATKMRCGVWELYEGKNVTAALPLYVILTLSATGSEMNCGSVLTNEKSQEKLSFGSPLVYPKVSIVNPSLAFTLPNDYLAYSAVDTIAHVIEGYFTAEEHPNIINRFCENIIKSVMETTEKILENPKDLDARNEFALCSTWALNGLATLGVGKCSFPNHMIEHSLSAIYNVPHGAGLSVVIPAWLKWFYQETKDGQVERFAKEIFNKNSADEGILELENWFKKINAPTTLSKLSIDKKDIDKIVENIILVAPKWGIEKIYSKKVLKNILTMAT
jgi:alcohol dehydrogenase YqhD (iron-dependent ADH family)